MKIKKTLFWGGMFMSAALAFSSCDKELDAENDNLQTNGDEDDYLVPFFEVAKGDSISKDVYRAKAYSEEEGSNEIVASDDENSAALRALATEEENLKYIIGVQARSFNSPSEAPSFYRSIPYNRSEPYYYYKLNFDLNAGAGGKYIYFYYCPTKLESSQGYSVMLRNGAFLRALSTYTTKKRGDNFNTKGTDWHAEGTNGCKGQQPSIESLYQNTAYYYGGTGAQVDLNEGAGGKYIYLFGAKSNKSSLAIKAIAISEKKKVSGGYKLSSGDLNDGAGGKYIYLHVKY